MELTREEEAALNGQQGEVLGLAYRILVATPPLQTTTPPLQT